MSNLPNMYLQSTKYKTNNFTVLNNTSAKSVTVFQSKSPKESLPKDTYDKKDMTNSPKILSYVLSGGVPAVFGMLHGVYKKIEQAENNIKFAEMPDSEGKLILAIRNPQRSPYKKFKIAQAIQLSQPVENKNVRIAIEILEHHKKTKLLLNANDTIDKLFNIKNDKIQLIIKTLLKKGFNPKKESLIDFLSGIDIDDFNKNNAINAKINFTDKKGRNLVQIIDGKYKRIVNKGWKVLPGRLVEVPIQETGLTELPSQIDTLIEFYPKSGKFNTFQNSTSKYAVFKKILNPYDEKVFSVIEKIPFGSKITNFMRKTESPIKNIKFRPFNKLFYDTTSLVKGAAVMAVVGTCTYSLVNVVRKSYHKYKSKSC